jgi:hypothetical protein
LIMLCVDDVISCLLRWLDVCSYVHTVVFE